MSTKTLSARIINAKLFNNRFLGRRFFRYLFRYLSFLLIGLVISITLLVTTNWGNRLLISTVHAVEPGINLELRHGSLFNDPEIAALSVNIPGVSLSIESVTIDWNWDCVTQSGLCIDSIAVDNIALDITGSGSEPPPVQNEEPVEQIELPFWLNVKQIIINNVAINALGNKISWRQLRLAIQFKDSTLNINNLTLNDLTAQLAGQSKEPATTAAIKPQSPDKQLIELPQVTLPLAIEINNLALLNTKIIQQGQVEKIAKIALDFSAKNSDIKIKKLDVEHQLAKIKLAGDLSLTGQYPLQVTTDIITGKKLAVGENTLNINLSGQLDKLVTALTISGDINASFDAQLNLLSPTLPFELAGNWQEFAVPNQPVTIKIGKIDTRGSLENFSYQLSIGLVGKQIPATDIALTGQGSQNDLRIETLKVNTLNGEINSSASVSWQDVLTWQANLALSNIEPQQMWPQLNASLSGNFNTSGKVDGKNWQVALEQLDLNGQWLNQPLSLSGSISGQSADQPDDKSYGQWQVQKVRLNSGINNILLNGTVDKTIDIAAELNIYDLAQSVPDVAGKFIASLQLSGNTTSPNLQFELNGSGIKAPALQLDIDSLDAQGKLASTLTDNNQLSLNIKRAKLATQQIDKANLTFSGSWQQHLATLKVDGTPVASDIELTGLYRDDHWQGEIIKSVIDSPVGRWLSHQEIAIDFDTTNQQLTIAKHCWQQQQPDQASAATLCLTEPTIAGKQGDVNIALSHFNLGSVNPLLQQQAQLAGIIDITASASWRPDSRPLANATIKGAQGEISVATSQGDFISHYSDLLATLALEPDQATIEFSIASPEIGELSLSADTDIYQSDSPLAGQLDLKSIKLAAFKKLVPDIDKLSGEINTSTKISGTLKTPLFNGDIKLSNGNITGLTLPAQIEKLNATIALNGNNADISSDFMLGGGSGKISGQVQWQPEVSASLTIDGSALTVTPNADMSITFSPAITAKYSTGTDADDQLHIGGQISVDKGLIKIEELPESAVSLSDDVVIVSSEQTTSVPPNKLALMLALKVLINEKLQIDAFGLTSRLAGQLSLAQDQQTPLTGHGELNLIDAKYIAMGQNLDIRRGQLLFTGSLSQPFLNIDAIRDPKLTQDDVIAGVNVTGSASQPKLTIFSEPAMPQIDAISYLLRGRKKGGQDTGTGEGMLVGLLLNSGVENTGKLVNDIGNKLGVTDMNLNTKGSGDDTAVEVSGYIAPNIELRYAVGVFDSQPELTIRYQLLPKLFVDIIKGTDEALDLLYQFDFD